jgi:predicted nuclease with RNAse H fold
LPDELASVPHHVPARWGNPGYCPPAPPYRVIGWRRGLAVAASWGVAASSLQNVADLRFNLGMRTLGIDLASQDERTAMAGIAWRQGVGIVEKPISPVSNEDALRAMKDAAWIGIDAPFGWPDSFVQVLPAYAATGIWPADIDDHALRLRFTDQFVRDHVGIWPLSVSSDRIAVPAWRCARLLAAHAPEGFDRIGRSHIVEVYPGAALTVWNFARRGYKRSGNGERQAVQRQAREALMAELAARSSDWLDLSAAHDECVKSDDALDAVLAGLVARATAKRLTWQPPDDWIALIAREGWIHVPQPGSFEQLPC